MIGMATLKRFMRRLRQLHPGLVLVALLLGAFGILMQYSAAGGDFTVFALPQTMKLLLGFGLMLVLAGISGGALLRFSYVYYGACIALLVAVEVAGVMGLGAQRWVGVGGANLQPSELMKIGIILVLARYLQHIKLSYPHHFVLLIVPSILTLVPVALILHQPNLGTATIVSVIAFAMCFMAGIRWWYFAGTLSAGAAAVPVIFHFLHDYQKQRVMTFLNPDSDPLGAGYNIIQSKIAIGSGGFFGKGLLNGSQGQLDFLPEKQTDFIFTMMTEELGFFGALLLLGLYAWLLRFAMQLAATSRNGFGRMVAAGVAAMFFIHMFINMAMVMGMIPCVGVPLPFLSYGGSFLLATMMAIGLLQHVYIHRHQTMARSSKIG